MRPRLASRPAALLLVVAAGAIGLGAWALLRSRPPAPVYATPLVEVAKLTGPGSINRTDVAYQVLGTDLGIMWANARGEVLIAFGDTFGHGWSGSGGGPGSADWRSNVLGRSSDADLSDGLTIDTMVQDRPGHAAELLASQKIRGAEETVIPTAGVAVGERQYLHYMSVNRWGDPGEWFTNYAGIAYSDDNGATWTKDPAARWENAGDWSSPFQMAAWERHGGFVYMFSTPNGRFGSAFVARVPEAELLDKSAYRYWDGSDWQADETKTGPIVAAPVGELSVQYNTLFRRWIMVYLDVQRYAIVLRDAPAPEGPWGEPQTLATGQQVPRLYGGYIHPASRDRAELYLTVSKWDPYNVYLMRTTLSREPAAPSGR